MAGRFVAVRDHLRQLGGVNGSLYLLNRGLERISRGWLRLVKYDLMVQPVPDEPLLPAHRGRNIQVHEAGRDDPVLAQAMGRPPETLQARFDAGARCLVAEIDGEFAGFLWFIQGDYDEDEVRCTFRPEPLGASVWDFDVLVAPQHRLSPVFLKLWQVAGILLREEGVAYACSRISAFNPRSRAAHVRLGAQRAGVALFLCAGICQLEIVTRPTRCTMKCDGKRKSVIRVGRCTPSDSD